MAAARAKEPDPPSQLRALATSLPPARGGAIARSYLVRGDERYFREQALTRIVDAARAAGLEVSRHDARDPDFVLAPLQDDLVAVPMFSAARCIVLRNATPLLKKEGKEDSSLTRALVAYAQGRGPAGGTLVVDAEGLRADHPLAKAVIAHGGRSLSLRRLWETPPPWNPDPRQAELVQWLILEARAREVELAPHDAVYVVAATGNDLHALDAALDRIKRSGGQSVRALVAWTNGASPFGLAEDLARGDVARSVAGIEALFRAGFQDKDGSRELDRKAIFAILLGTLRNKLRQSLAGALALERGLDLRAAAEKAGAAGSPAMKAEFEARVRSHSASDWKRRVGDLAAFERRTRSAETVDANDLVLLALRWKHTGRTGRATRRT